MFDRAFLCVFLLSSYTKCFAHSYDHLPLCEQLRTSFPILNATCFIIVNKESNTILHEKNSFYDILYDDNKSKKSLHALSCKYNDFSSSSQISGMTFVFTYKNKHNCFFKIALSGINTIELFQEDKKKISEWLNQFFLFKACKKNELLAKIPVIYGDNIESIDMLVNNDIYAILSSKQNNKIKKTVTYKSIVNAPFDQSMQLGSLSLFTKVFVNPLKIDIFPVISVKKGGKWKTLLDSIKYLIFGPTF